ncbi:hypothetical protein LZ30DRAFT_59491 [Colletotrichum cereale]|nr:hypothetical protein LZ30DRAFT_59491 [Colletotrichum cereale]
MPTLVSSGGVPLLLLLLLLLPCIAGQQQGVGGAMPPLPIPKIRPTPKGSTVPANEALFCPSRGVEYPCCVQIRGDEWKLRMDGWADAAQLGANAGGGGGDERRSSV